MPKIAKSQKAKALGIINKYLGEFSMSPNNTLFCLYCNTSITCDKMFFIEKHRATAKHSKSLTKSECKSNSGNIAKQQFLQFSNEDFPLNVTKAFLAANIPLWKLRNQSLRKLFSSIGHLLPSEDTCRSRISHLYNEEMIRIKEYVNEKEIFLVVDEAEVITYKCIHILIGTLENPSVTYLCECLFMDSFIDSSGIVRIINDIIPMLGIKRENFCLLLTDAARYMTCAFRTLEILYPRLFHVTCIAHLLHNCAMRIRNYFPDVDNLIASIKAACVKNKQRQRLFQKIGPPPTPIVTRWGSWLEASSYYAEHLPEVRIIVQAFEGKGILVTEAKKAITQNNLTQNLLIIKNCYYNLASFIKKCESSNISIKTAFHTLECLSFGEDPCGIREYIKKRICKNGINSIMEFHRDDISPQLYGMLQHCQPTTSSVERSFSMLKKLLAKERNFRQENIKKYIIMYVNKCEYVNIM